MGGAAGRVARGTAVAQHAKSVAWLGVWGAARKGEGLVALWGCWVWGGGEVGYFVYYVLCVAVC